MKLSRLLQRKRTNLPKTPVTGSWLVVGLGNPGPNYEWTRHNVGFMTVDVLARRAGVKLAAARGARAEVGETRLSSVGIGVPVPDSVRLVLAKPVTYMNESGQAVGRLTSFYKIVPEQVIVVHDELDLDPGRMRLKKGGGDNGHNGLKSIRAHLNTGEFFRVRIGIGRPPGRQAGADYVLAKIPSAAREDFGVAAEDAADAVEELILSGLEAAQNRFNH